MNSKFIFIALSCFVFLFGFVLGRMDFATPADDTIQSFSEKVQEVTEAKDTGTETVATDTAPASNNTNTGATTPPTMTESQKAMLKSFGLDPATVTITPAMIACAEAKVGSARLEEIKNGATPSFLEGASLLACYKK